MDEIKATASKSGITCRTSHPGVPEKWLHVQPTKAFAATKTDKTIMQATRIRLDRIAGDEEPVCGIVRLGGTLVVVGFILAQRIQRIFFV